MEIFKDIPGYPGYKISDHGNLWNMKLKRILESPLNKDGYQRIGLWNSQVCKKFFIHRLVAIAFIPNPEDKPQINHKDGNRTNNNLSNLEWVTNQENITHRIEILGYNGTKGIHSKPITLIKDSEELCFNTTREAMKFLSCGGNQWNRLKDGLRPNIKGYKIKV